MNLVKWFYPVKAKLISKVIFIIDLEVHSKSSDEFDSIKNILNNSISLLT